MWVQYLMVMIFMVFLVGLVVVKKKRDEAAGTPTMPSHKSLGIALDSVLVVFYLLPMLLFPFVLVADGILFSVKHIGHGGGMLLAVMGGAYCWLLYYLHTKRIRDEND